jgi:3-methyladenine DNA glycosylase AlkD
MKVDEIIEELRSLGSESTKRVLMNHGAQEPFFGVKIEHLQKIRKRLGVNYKLALQLYDTGISDAMYLAGLIADDARMTKKDLQSWVNGAYWYMLSEFTVPRVAAGSPFGHEVATKWIESKKEHVAAAGWATFSSIVAIKPDSELDLAELKELLDRVAKTVHEQPNRVRYAMNCFVIAVGGYVVPLTEAAMRTGRAIGRVSVDMGNTSCNVPLATDYIASIRKRGNLGKKRKTAKC